tara:strand:+ start:704 stop:1132 length:429 start_codon:yes stop_codon:yes gene_type:complete
MTVKNIFEQIDKLKKSKCNKKSEGIKQNIKVGEIDYFKNFLILFFLLVAFFIIINLITSDENIPEEPPKPLRKIPDQIAENLKEKPVELKPVTKPVPKPTEPPKVVKEKKLKDVIKEYKTKSPYEFCWLREKETNDDSCYFF